MLLREFKDLRRKRDKLLGLPDQLNYAIPVDDYTIALKDGAFLSAFECSGLDLNSASVEELDAHRAQGNRALARLDDGFQYNIDLIRYPSVEYPSRTFPDPVSAALDREREIQYSEEGQHFETRCRLTITYRLPADAQTRIAGIFLSGAPKRADWRRQLSWFKQKLREFEDAISPVWKLTPLRLDALLSHLAGCINGRMCEIAVPGTPTYLDAVLGNQDLIAGFKPRIGGRHIRVVALAGFPPFSFAEMAAFLTELPICYRYSVRGIPVGPRTAISQLTVYRRNWFQKRLGLRGIISEHFGSGAGAAFQNQHALKMAADADEAINEAEGGAVRYCYVTPKVIVTEDRADIADENAQLVFKVCQNMGFDPRIESINAVEAWLGSLPGHGWYDVRRPLVNTQNLADILPLTSIWPGLAMNPCPYYPKNTPALCYGATTGSTPFRLNLHVGDTGHTGIYGPTGSGKSVALGTIAANFRAVPDGQVFFFDKGYSAFVLTKALGGQHLDLGEDEVPLQPLARVDDETDRMKLQSLLEDWLELQSVRLVPAQRKALWRALELVGEGPAEQRTISNLVTQVQDNSVRDGLNAFSLAGPLGRFLDADHDVLLEGRFVTFELETLMAMGPKVVVPVATYLFHRIDQRLDGRPTLIILDEAWIMLTNSVFGAKVEEWLRTLRKKNAAVVLATQSLAEIANSPHRDVILESCPTKLYLPNAEAKNAASRETYRRFGLSDRQIDIVADATPKRHYYYVSPLGRRLFQFSLGPAALAFIGAGSKDDVLSARRMIEQHGDRWTVEWLRARGLPDWAEYLDKLHRQFPPPLRSDHRSEREFVPCQWEAQSKGDSSMNSRNSSQQFLAIMVALICLFGRSVPARAQFGGGTQIVFDPQMFARQLQQLQQETATVTNLAQQLQYAIKNTTGGGAGVWQSNQNLLTNLGNLINEQEGLSYTFQGLTQEFQQLYPGFSAASTAGVQSPQATIDTTLNTLNGALASAQAQAQNFQAEQASLQTLELKNQTAIGNLQAVQVSNEIALAQVQQVQMLRQLVMAEMNSQNVAAANQLNNQVQTGLEAQALFSAPPPAGTPDFLGTAATSPPPQP